MRHEMAMRFHSRTDYVGPAIVPERRGLCR